MTPIEAGLGFAVAWDKPGGFRGRDALLRRREAGVPTRRLVGLAVEDPDVIIWGGERIYLDGAGVGYTTSASYGHSVGRAIALGYVNAGQPVTADLVASGRFELDVAGDRVPVRATLSPVLRPEARASARLGRKHGPGEHRRHRRRHHGLQRGLPPGKGRLARTSC